MAEFPGEHFTVVVARGGEDLWAEIRRRTVPDEDRVPVELFGSTASEGRALTIDGEISAGAEDVEPTRSAAVVRRIGAGRQPGR